MANDPFPLCLERRIFRVPKDPARYIETIYAGSPIKTEDLLQGIQDEINDQLKEILQEWEEGFRFVGLHIQLRNILDSHSNPDGNRIFARLLITRMPERVPMSTALESMSTIAAS